MWRVEDYKIKELLSDLEKWFHTYHDPFDDQEKPFIINLEK